MKNTWLASLIGMLLGGVIVGGYMWHQNRQSSTTLNSQLKTTQQSNASKKSKF